MSWTLTRDPEAYARQVLGMLAARPVENTLALTILGGVRGGHRYSADPPIFGWYDAGQLAGAILMTPPHPLVLAMVPEASVPELVRTLRDEGVDIPGANGDAAIVDRFAEAWTAGTALESTTAVRTRLYRLARLNPTPHPPHGSSRAARAGDQELVVHWFEAFQEEIEDRAGSFAAVAAKSIEDGRIWLWDDATGTAVSLAGRQRTTAGVARVGPVYTPPEFRARGYGTAVTTACTADALAQGARDVVLFTDLDNPTSNSIYQQIGFEPVTDRAVVRFAPAPAQGSDV